MRRKLPHGQREQPQTGIDQLAHYRQLLEQVVDQTERRVLNGENVSASEKLVSLFEPHTDIIINPREIEYRHKINLATDNNGLITALMIVAASPADTERFITIIEWHRSLYGRLPDTTIADGGYASQDNIAKGKPPGCQTSRF